jgi:hypothetical protein
MAYRVCSGDCGSPLAQEAEAFEPKTRSCLHQNAKPHMVLVAICPSLGGLDDWCSSSVARSVVAEQVTTRLPFAQPYLSNVPAD